MLGFGGNNEQDIIFDFKVFNVMYLFYIFFMEIFDIVGIRYIRFCGSIEKVD